MGTDLRTEIKQSAPFQSAGQEAFLNLIRTTAALEHAFSEGLKPFGVTLTQYNVLRILRGAHPDGLCRNDVRDRMLRRVPDATRLLDRLEEAGWIERCRQGDDRRFVVARITPSGLDLLARIDEPSVRLNEAYLGHMTDDELRRLAELLTKARARC